MSTGDDHSIETDAGQRVHMVGGTALPARQSLRVEHPDGREPTTVRERSITRVRARPGRRGLTMSVVGGVLVAVLVCLLAPYGGQPAADARAHFLTPGPAVTAYPWSTERDKAAVDPWGFLKRQCTSYAAWFLNSHGVPFARRTRGPTGVGAFDNAGEWDRGAAAAGFPVSRQPAVGAIAQWRAWEASPPSPRFRDVPARPPYVDEPDLLAGSNGHVAVVTAVLPDDTVLVTGYDGRDRQLQWLRTRAPRYLYIGVPHASSPPASPAAASPPAVPAPALFCS